MARNQEKAQSMLNRFVLMSAESPLMIYVTTIYFEADTYKLKKMIYKDRNKKGLS